MSYVVGLDLGRAQEYTALAAVERLEDKTWNMQAREWKYDEVRYHLRHLHRFKLGTSYPAIIEQVGALMASEPLKGDVRLVLDITAVGPPLVELFRRADLGLVAVTITNGTAAEGTWYNLTVPRRDLTSQMLILFQTGRLKIAAEMAEAKALIDDLQAFQIKPPRPDADPLTAWREGPKDDLVLAVAIALWYDAKHGGPLIY